MANIHADFHVTQAAIDAARVVSFDFFDTLVVRTVEEPWHAFFIVEQTITKKTARTRPFVAQRRQAEAIARQRVWKKYARVEVTLDEIYDVMIDLGFTPSDCRLYKGEEISVEKQVCYAEPFNKKLYDYALATGKAVIIITDIYLPSEVIEEIATQCGYTGHHQTFISSFHGESKSADGLFAGVLDALRKGNAISSPSELLHIGDNHHSDIKQAQKWGIKTRHHPRPLERFRRDGLGSWNLLDQLPQEECPLTRSLTIGLYTRYWLENGARAFDQMSMRDIGFYVVGPMLAGFAEWIRSRCVSENVSKLFFLARDGWVFRQAFEKICAAAGLPIATEYVYASRRAVYMPSLTELDGAANKFFVAYYGAAPTLREYFERLSIPIEPFMEDLITIFGGLDIPVAGFDFRLGHFFRRRVFPNIREQLERERELVTAYMAQMGMLDGTVAVCDIGYFGSMQSGFERLARLAGHDARYKGYYFATHDKQAYGHHEMTGWLFDAQKPKAHLDAFSQSTSIMELFFTGLHGTVLGYVRNGDQVEPVLRPITPEEEERFVVVQEIQAGALDFVDLFVRHSGVQASGLSANFCLAPWKSFIHNPPPAVVNLFKNVKHNEGAGVSCYAAIIPSAPTWHDIIRHPYCLVQSYRQSLWREGYRASLLPAKRRCLDYFMRNEALAHKIGTAMDKLHTMITWRK